MNDIKARIKSVSGTMQITKAMELVAISKLRRAKESVERSRPYYNLIGDAIKTVVGSSEVGSSVWFSPKTEGKTLFVVVAGDRGLAGGYNSNVFKLTDALLSDGAVFLPVGKKSVDHYKHAGSEIFSDAFVYVADVSVGDAFAMADLICRAYASGEFSRVELVYTRFISMMSQSPVHEQLLPLTAKDGSKDVGDPIWDGEPEEILDRIVPQYVGGVLYSSICEAIASELSARRMSMNAANKNASEMIDSLMLGYNRARQAVITQEITEIVSGAEAL